jgi:nitroreductase
MWPDLSAVDAVAQRHSVRAFLPREVEPALLDDILTRACRAPSGTNIQPWRVHVLTGLSRQNMVSAVCEAFDAHLTPPAGKNHSPEYDYYPKEFFGDYLARRRKVGFDMYALLGIEKGDKLAMAQQHRRNYTFFDAPVGLMFTIDRRMGQGSWLDYGMFIQNIMVLAKARGLDTCAQAAWIEYHRIIGEQLRLAPNEQFVCGMALGYADTEAVVNSLVTERAGLGEMVVRHD